MQEMLQTMSPLKMVAIALLVIAMFAIVVVPAILEGTKPRFQLGLGSQREHVAQSHGFVWVKSRDGGQAAKPFTIDDPKVLERPSRRVRMAMLEQIITMGLIPTHIEICLQGQRRVYKTDGRVPSLVYAA